MVHNVSVNGWPVLDARDTFLWQVPGTGRHLRLAPGPPGFLLTHLALWFHERIEPLNVPPWDDWAHAVRPIRGGGSVMSNHASGTAVDLNAQLHPMGSRNTFAARDTSRIRARLRGVYGGAIRWGGDWATRPDEMHFELDSQKSLVLEVADRLRNSPRGRRVLDGNPEARPFLNKSGIVR